MKEHNKTCLIITVDSSNKWDSNIQAAKEYCKELDLIPEVYSLEGKKAYHNNDLYDTILDNRTRTVKMVYLAGFCGWEPKDTADFLDWAHYFLQITVD